MPQTKPGAMDFLNQASALYVVIKRQDAQRKKIDEKIFGLIAQSKQADENIDELCSQYNILYKQYEAAELKEGKESKRPSARKDNAKE